MLLQIIRDGMNIREDIKEKGENIFSEDNFGEQKRLQAHVDFQT